MKIKILCPDMVSGKKGNNVTLYKNNKGLYIAILNGVEVGIAKEVESDSIIKLPNCIDCTIEEDFERKFSFSVVA